MADYHSSLKEDVKDLKEIDYYHGDKGVVFFHDLEKGTTDAFANEQFNKCDAVYSEPSWVYGYKIFGERAGSSSGLYKRYLAGMKQVLDMLKKPTFLVIGKQAIKVLKPDHVKEVRFIGGKHNLGMATLMVFNHEQIPEENTVAIQRFVCGKFDRVLDFNCGYGSICQSAKKFVCSDINKKCVWYVANKYLGAI